MLMTPVSLIFLSVPVSSSALAAPAQRTAATAIPVIRRHFIRISLTPTTFDKNTLPSTFVRVFQPRLYVRNLCKDRAAPADRTPHRKTLHDFIGIGVGGVGWLGEFMSEFGPHRHVEV